MRLAVASLPRNFFTVFDIASDNEPGASRSIPSALATGTLAAQVPKIN